MLKNMGIRHGGGSASEQLQSEVSQLITQFETILESISVDTAPKIIRPMLPGNVYVIVDPEKIIVAYAPKAGIEVLINEISQNLIPSQLARELSLARDLDDVHMVVIPRALLTATPEERNNALIFIAQETKLRLLQNAGEQSMANAISPIFGPLTHRVQEKLIFVLMPFQDKLDAIYTNVIKPSIEDDIHFVCRRADELKSNKPLIQDIWKSICEARVVIADLTGFNPNVMYELGIAHTVGKPTILLHQEIDATVKFPFDLAHIRRIIYTDTAAGGSKLRKDLVATLRTVIQLEA